MAEEIALVIEGKAVTCNKELLETSSDYFKAMFNSSMKEATQTEITIKDVSHKIFCNIYNFIQDGDFQLTMDNIWEILSTASMLQFHKVMEGCEKYLMDHMTIQSSLESIIISHRCGLSMLLEFAKRYALWNFDTFVQSDILDNITFDIMLELLETKRGRITSEDKVFDWVFAWIQQKSAIRSSFTYSLLQNVQLGCVSTYKLKESLCSSPIEGCDQSRTLLDEVIEAKSTDKTDALAPFFLPRRPREVIIFTSSKLAKQEAKSSSDSQPAPSKVAALFELDVNGDHPSIYKLASFPPENQELTIGYSLTAYEGNIYFCGGEVKIGSGRWMMDLWKFDTFTYQWSIVSKLPRQRRHHVALADESLLYLIGGYGKYRIRLNSIDVYNMKTGEWFVGVDLPEDACILANGCICNHTIYLFSDWGRMLSLSSGSTHWSMGNVTIADEFCLHFCTTVSEKILIALRSTGDNITRCEDIITYDTITGKQSTQTLSQSYWTECGIAAINDELCYVTLGPGDSPRVHLRGLDNNDDGMDIGLDNFDMADWLLNKSKSGTVFSLPIPEAAHRMNNLLTTEITKACNNHINL